MVSYYEFYDWCMMDVHTLFVLLSYMRDNHGSLSDGIQQWTPAGARRFIVRALSHRRRGQRGSRPASRTAMMSHIAQLPPALLLDSLIGSSSREMGYEVIRDVCKYC